MRISKSFRLALRRIWSFKLYSIISIVGLGLAIAIALAIFSYTIHHASYDRFIENGENAYRLNSRYGEGTFNTNTFASFEDELASCPEVNSFTMVDANNAVEDLRVDGEKFKVNYSLFVNQSFLDFYNIPMVVGEEATINEPNMVFLTAATAEKIFPNQSAIGQKLLVRAFTGAHDSLIAYTVGGIVEEMPKTSHLQYEVLFSRAGHYKRIEDILKSRKLLGARIYVKLQEGTDVQNFESRLTSLLVPHLKGFHGPPLEAFNHHLQPVFDIHFTTGLLGEMKAGVRRSSHHILLLVGIIILALAMLNFVIMYIAKASFYRKANFIIRIMGGSKREIFMHTLMEVVISVAISMIVAFYLLVSFQHFLGMQYFGDFSISFLSYDFFSICLLLLVVVSLLISIFASYDLRKKEDLLTEVNQRSKRKIAVTLLVFQFVAVIALMGFTIMINQQLDYIHDKDLGYASENVIIIKAPQLNEKVNILKEELKKSPFLLSTAAARHYPGYKLQDMTFSNGENSFPFIFGHIDTDALETLKIPVLLYFKPAKEKADDGWYINETFYHSLQQKYSEEEIRGSSFPADEEDQDPSRIQFNILGVMRDFHYASLHSDIESFAFFIPAEGNSTNRFVLVRFQISETQNVIKLIEEKMAQIFPDQPIRYDFLEEQVQQQYESESVLMKLINTFSLLSILIACFGLIGLSVFISEQRTKEIGIRKVNGASVSEIINLLLKDVLMWISIAFLLATPLSYFAISRWLENFAYKTPIDWWIFLLSGLMALIIAIITVSWQTFKSARRNPVEALRYE